MRFLPILLILASAAAPAAEQPPARLPVRVALSAELRQQIHASGTAETTPALAVPQSTENPVIRMKPVVVTAPARIRDLDAAFEAQDLANDKRRLSFKNPLTLFDRDGKVFAARLEIRLTPHDQNDGFDFLHLGASW